MTKRARILAAAAVAVAFAFTIPLLRRVPDPVYRGRPTSEWVADLLDYDYNKRNDAREALRALGKPAVPQLRVLLTRRDLPLKDQIIRLNNLLPFLNFTLYDARQSRQSGAEMLGLLGPEAVAAADDLVDCLRDDAAGEEAERALSRIGMGTKPRVIAALRSRHGKVRERAARLLREMRPLEAVAVAGLLSATGDSEAAVREQVASTLAVASVQKREVAEALIVLASDKEPAVRAAALAGLGRLEFGSSAVIQALGRGMADTEAVCRLKAAKAHWTLKRNPGAVVPVLSGILGTSEGWQAAYALGELEQAAEPAVPALVDALIRERVPRPFRTPPSSAFALGRIGAGAVPALVDVLDSPDPLVRMSAVMAFGFMGSKGGAAVPALLPLLQDEEIEVRHATALTLASIGAEPERIIPALSDCLRAEDIYMRSAAAAALREIAPDREWVIQPE